MFLKVSTSSASLLGMKLVKASDLELVGIFAVFILSFNNMGILKTPVFLSIEALSAFLDSSIASGFTVTTEFNPCSF